MAEVTGLRNNALPYPVYGAPWGIVLPILDADGDLVTGATGLDSEVSKNGDTFADCTNEATEIATSSGFYYLLLTATEMTADVVTGITKTSTSGAKTTPWALYPKKLPAIRSGTAQAGAAGTITLDSDASAVDDAYNGCLIVATLDGAVEARIITDYNGSTKVASVTPNWNTTPDSDDTFIIYLPDGVQVPTVNTTHFGSAAGTFASGRPEVNVSHWLGTAAATPTVAGVPEVDVTHFGGSAGGFTSGRPDVESVNDPVTVGTNNDKTGYGLADGAITAAKFATGAIDAAALAADAATEIATAVWAAGTRTLTSISGLGIALADKLLGYVQLLARKDAAIATDRSTELGEINADEGSGAGAYVSTTDSQEAIRDNMGTPQTGDSFARLGAPAGASVSADIAALPTAAENADQVWEEAIADHSGTAGSTAEQLAAAGAAGDPWATALPGSYTSGQAGKIVGDNLNATVSSRATQTSVDTIDNNVDTLLTRITSTLFSGITSLAEWLGLIAGRQTGNATARTELRATGAGSGTYDETADSQEAIRDRGDAAWATATGFSTHSAADVWAVGTRTLTSFGTLVSDTATAVWSAGTRTLTAFDAAFKTGYALSSAGVQAIWDALTSALTTVGSIGKLLVDNVNATISSRLPTSSYTAPLDAAGTRAAVGLASANLDTQLNALPTAAENASQVRTELTTELARLDAAVSTRATPTQVNSEADQALVDAGVTSARMAKLDNLPEGVKKNQALAAFEFFMADSADHVTGKTGLTVTAERSIDGGAFAACANSPAEVSGGVYKIDLAAADLNGDVITLKMTAAGADATLVTLKTSP